MSDGVFVVRNQLGQYWARSKEWVDGREPQRLLKLKYHDEAVNQLVELSAKDIDLRGDIIECEVNAKKEAQVEPSQHLTPTLAEIAAANAVANEAEATAQDQDTAGEVATESSTDDPVATGSSEPAEPAAV